MFSRLVESDSKSLILRGDNDSEVQQVTSKMTTQVTRDMLNTRITCKVANQAMEQHVMIARVQLDINLSPTSTVITAEAGHTRGQLQAGDQIQLTCKSDGARPAATLRSISHQFDKCIQGIYDIQGLF